MNKVLILTFFLYSSLFSNVTFKGICNNYQIDVDISSSRYTDLYCLQPHMLVWDKNDRLYKRVEPISGGVYTGISVQTLKSNGSIKEEKWLSTPKGSIKRLEEPSTNFLYGLAGLLCGLSLLYPIMRT